MPQSSEPVRQLLTKWKDGDPDALQALIPAVYDELHALAHHFLRAERPGHTLQSTALVHEAYLRLVARDAPETQNRAHFVATAARLMRQILVDYARNRRAAKRGPGYKIEFVENCGGVKTPPLDLVALDDALNDLARHDAQQVQIVEMRYFGGLTVEETAEILNISPAP